MVVDNQKKYVHIAIPRTATTCVNTAIGNLKHPEPKLHHAKLSEVLESNPHAIEYFKFTFVRNPWDRLVSLYHEFRKNRGRQYSEFVFFDNPLLSEYDVSDNDIDNFRNFCRNLHLSDWKNDLFFHNQYEYITYNNEVAMDFIGRFENIDSDWENVRDKIGFSGVNLRRGDGLGPRGFIRGSNHLPYKEYYTQTEIDIVAEIYKTDIEYFNYTF